MDFQYPTIYSDRRGVETANMHNDGTTLALVLRGVLFSGRDFDSLEPDKSSEARLLKQFSLVNGSLCECTIQCEMPIPLVVDNGTASSLLVIQVKLGAQAANGGLDEERVILSLRVGETTYRSTGKGGWFENELLELQKALPNGTYLKACINCGLSDYWPGGNPAFGGMLCFRDCKDHYRKVRGKSDLFKLLEAVAKPMTVQETFLCPQFERRQPGTGYRG